MGDPCLCGEGSPVKTEAALCKLLLTATSQMTSRASSFTRDKRAQGSLSEFSEDICFVNDIKRANGKNNSGNINSTCVLN